MTLEMRLLQKAGKLAHALGLPSQDASDAAIDTFVGSIAGKSGAEIQKEAQRCQAHADFLDCVSNWLITPADARAELEATRVAA
jgi:hypothetical protein